MKLTRLLAIAFLALATSTTAHALVAPRPRPTPVPPAGWTYIWVNPLYRTVTERNWVPERIQLVSQWMETSPGHMELVYRQITIPGHYETTTRQILLADGHWELVQLNPPPIYYPPYNPPIIVRNPPTVGVEGYAQIQTEDLSRFTPLSEWPR